MQILIVLILLLARAVFALDCSKPPAGYEWFFANEGYYNTEQKHSYALPDRSDLEVETHKGFTPMPPEELVPFTLYEAELPDPATPRFRVETRNSEWLAPSDYFFSPAARRHLFFNELVPPPPDLREQLRVRREWCGQRMLGGPLSEGRVSIFVWLPELPEQEPFVLKFTSDPRGIFNPLIAVALNDHLEANLRRAPDRGFYLYPERFAYRVKDESLGRYAYGVTYRRLNVPRPAHLKKTRVVPLSVVLGKPGELDRLAAREGLSVKDWKRNILLPRLADLIVDSILKVGVLPLSHVQNTDLLFYEGSPPPGESWLASIVIKDIRDMKVMPSFSLLLGKASRPPLFDAEIRQHVGWFDPGATVNPSLHTQEYTAQILFALSESASELRETTSRLVELCLERYRATVGTYPPLPPSVLRPLSQLSLPAALFDALEIDEKLRTKTSQAYRQLWGHEEARERNLRLSGLTRYAFGEAIQGIAYSAWSLGAAFALQAFERKVAEEGEPDWKIEYEKLMKNTSEGRYFRMPEEIFAPRVQTDISLKLADNGTWIIPLHDVQYVMGRSRTDPQRTTLMYIAYGSSHDSTNDDHKKDCQATLTNVNL